MSSEDLKDDSEDENMECEIQELKNSMFQTSYHVARQFYGGLIGQRGKTKRRMESQCQVQIVLPDHRSKESKISIKGKNKQSIYKAIRSIDDLTASLRLKSRPTHFTCVPACTDTMKKSFNALKDSIIADGYYGIDENLFIYAEKIHITFAPCALLDDQDKQKAKEVFEECSQDFVNKKSPIMVTVRGVKKFDDERAQSVRVLFAGIQSTELQAFADNVLQKFKQAQLNSEDYGDSAKLHMTIMNVRYRLKFDPKKSTHFNAAHILRKYADFDFGTFPVNEIHLSQMGTSDNDGFYKALCKVSI